MVKTNETLMIHKLHHTTMQCCALLGSYNNICHSSNCRGAMNTLISKYTISVFVGGKVLPKVSFIFTDTCTLKTDTYSLKHLAVRLLEVDHWTKNIDKDPKWLIWHTQWAQMHAEWPQRHTKQLQTDRKHPPIDAKWLLWKASSLWGISLHTK